MNDRRTISMTALAAMFFFALAGASQAAITYVDASSTNTTVDGAAMIIEPTVGFNVGNESGGTTDGLWSLRNDGTAGTVFAAHPGDGGVDETLNTTVSGLAAAKYRVWVYARTNGISEWDIAADLNGGTTVDVVVDDAGTVASSQTFVADPTPFVVSGTTLYAIELGTFFGTGFTVNVNEGTAGTGGDPRTWYDGVGFELVPTPEPSTFVLAALSLIGLAVRRRRRSV